MTTFWKILNAKCQPLTTTPNWEESPTLHFPIPFRYVVQLRRVNSNHKSFHRTGTTSWSGLVDNTVTLKNWLLLDLDTKALLWCRGDVFFLPYLPTAWSQPSRQLERKPPQSWELEVYLRIHSWWQFHSCTPETGMTRGRCLVWKMGMVSWQERHLTWATFNDVCLILFLLTQYLNNFSQRHVMSMMLSTTKLYSTEVLMLQELVRLHAFDMATFVQVRW